ncbi:hypothetical protein BOX15_Mlig002511g1 [Macrostomum lignano]|uniref:P/Homo B domain-containing protein n=2 Tax=Macrostomum lignano TaxID=282301 RepID=A0A267G4G7_9PLAT|nr:hypothetical protein BOX15_Mlig002511g1 [Macrostomum lignano]
MIAYKRSKGLPWLLACIFSCAICVYNCQEQLTDHFALELLDNSDISVAKEIAKKHNFDLLHHAQQLGNVYHLQHRSACKSNHTANQCATDGAALIQSMLSHPRVLRSIHQVAEDVEKRHLDINEFLRNLADGVDDKSDDSSEESRAIDKRREEIEDAKIYKKALSRRHLDLIVNDPHFNLQWYLHNTGQLQGINPGLDLNLLPAWNRGFTGSGIVVSVVDDGLDPSNPDLKNYDPLASADFNNLTRKEGIPIRSGPLTMEQTHGTACAGEIGALANNSFCGIGVAFNAKLGGIRILDGVVTDLLEAYAILHNNQYISVYSCSWGPRDNGLVMDMPKFYTSKALQLGVSKGRGGKGSLFVMASGNGGKNADNCGADGFVNNPHTIAVGALNIFGRTPYYGESCSAIHVSAPVGGPHTPNSKLPDYLVTTTMVNGGCFKEMSGTSAATPLVSSCVALALQANPELSWRDVQHLLSRSARLPSSGKGDPKIQSWQVNGAGHHVSHHAGFGLLDCAKLVFTAQTWPGVTDQIDCRDAKPYRGKFRVPSRKPLTLPFDSRGCNGTLKRLEHVLVTLTMQGMAMRGAVEIWLKSPAGTESRLLGMRPKDKDNRVGIKNQTFLTLLNWDENPAGRWLLQIWDRGGGGRRRGVVTEASVQFLGSSGARLPPVSHGRARWLTPDETTAAFRSQRLASAAQEVLHPELATLSRRLHNALVANGNGSGGGDLTAIVNEARRVVSKKGVTDEDLKYLLRQIDSAL